MPGPGLTSNPLLGGSHSATGHSSSNHSSSSHSAASLLGNAEHTPARQPLAQDRFVATPSASSASLSRSSLLREPAPPPVDPRLDPRLDPRDVRHERVDPRAAVRTRSEAPVVAQSGDPSDIPAFLRRRDDSGFIR
jgi:hypothetical protein